MMHNLYLSLITLSILTLASCSNTTCNHTKKDTPPGGSDPSAIIATVNGQNITVGELNKAAKSQLLKFHMEEYRIKKRELDNIIETKLLEAAAKADGKKIPDYLKTAINDQIKDPSDEEIKGFYSARQIKQPFDNVKGQIKAYIKRQYLTQKRGTLIQELKKKANVSIALTAPRATLNLVDAPRLGPKDAKVTLVEFSDYQCPYCSRVRPTINRLLDEYKEKLAYVFKDFPLSFHKDAQKAHEAAYCANDQKRYFEFHKKLFKNQRNVKVAELKKYATELQLDADKFNTCLDQGKYAEKVQKNIMEGSAAGVTGTPAFFINGIMLSGAQPYEALKEIIDEELNN